MTELPDPVSIYLSIESRVNECRATGVPLSVPESKQAFGMLMYACNRLIAENHRLQQSNDLSNALIEQLEIDLTVKDIELFTYSSTDTSQGRDE